MADQPATDPVVDAHHHIWRQADLPWLQGPTVPRIFGPYDPIKRDYDIAEFRRDAEPWGVVKSVYVQANWPKDKAVEEVAWVQSVADETGWPHGIVGYADFAAGDAAEVLARAAKHPHLRGMRQQLHWHENPLYRFAPRPDGMNDPAFRRNLAKLQDHGLLFELQVFAPQMADGAALAAEFPGIQFVLEHAGMLEDLSSAGRAAWREGMKRLAARPNMHTKLSGLGTFLRRNDPAHSAEVIGETVALFGAGRCLWGSNFPIEKLWTGYGALLGTVQAALGSLAPEDRRAILHDNAVRLYRL